MARLEEIIAHGNRGHGADLRASSTITCADGFSVSVIAGGGTYCSPRPPFCSYPIIKDHCSGPSTFHPVACDYPGPYHLVEVGYPSERPEPWADWSEWFEDFGDTDPTEGVYGYVPVERVRELIAAHGGEKS